MEKLVASLNPHDFHYVSKKMREFFISKGLVEVPSQCNLSILAACEDPQNLGTFNFINGLPYPLIQTGQMVLEETIMKDPSVPGYFCYTTSYRFEKNPKVGRHNLIFPMMEFEIKGSFNDLINFEKELLEYLGFGNKNSFPEGDYLDLCKKYGVSELTHEHEEMMLKDYGPVFFLKNFPEHSSPFWNMKRDSVTGLAKKCDIIINGIETFGSAERSCDVDEMRNRFYTISNGEYAKALYDLFGKERVIKELDNFLANTFFERSGTGCGMSRLLSAMKALNLIPERST